MNRNFSITNFEQASSVLSNQEFRKIDTHSHIKRNESSISVFLDGLEIVTYHQNGIVEIKNHGHYNLRFKRYLSQLCPSKIVQREYQWYVGDKIFFSHMILENGDWRRR